MAATYPTAVRTFSLKTNLPIQPSHINDLQEEVAALEAGLLTGTAPLSASNSSVTSLLVSGGSTLGSTLVIGTNTYIFSTAVPGSTGLVLGSQTLSGSTVTLGYLSVAAPAASTVNVFRATLSTPLQLADTVEGALDWNVEQQDPGGFHSTSVNSSLVTIPTGSSGYYWISVIAYANQPTNVGALTVYKGSSEMCKYTRNDATGGPTTFMATGLVFLDAAKAIKVGFYSNAGTTNSLSSLTQLQMIRVGG